MSTGAIAAVGNSNAHTNPPPKIQKTDVAGVVAQAESEPKIKKHDVAGTLAFGAMNVPPEGTRDLAFA